MVSDDTEDSEDSERHGSFRVHTDRTVARTYDTEAPDGDRGFPLTTITPLPAGDRTSVVRRSVGRKRGQDRTHLSTVVPEDLWVYLEGEAHAKGVPRSELIRDILTQWVYGHREETPHDAMMEVKQTAFRWLRYKLTETFREWTDELPQSYEELRRRLASYDIHRGKQNYSDPEET